MGKNTFLPILIRYFIVPFLARKHKALIKKKFKSKIIKKSPRGAIFVEI